MYEKIDFESSKREGRIVIKENVNAVNKTEENIVKKLNINFCRN